MADKRPLLYSSFLRDHAGTEQTGVTGDTFMGTVSCWAATDSPTEGAYIAADGSLGWDGTISQVVSGLTSGIAYTFEFDWAVGQQRGYDGATTEAWRVTFGSSTQSTSTVNLPNHEFSGWSHESLSFVADSSSQILSYLAVGTPGGLPPWLVLDGVIVKDPGPGPSPVPEPSTLAIVAVGALGLIARRIRRKTVQA
jgi:PEP-CTERM motif